MVSRAWWLLALAGCSEEPLTELVLSADSDLALDKITFEVSATGETTRTAEATRSGQGPSYVSIVRERGPLGPITVVARGMAHGSELLHRTHVVEFVPGRSLLVSLDLYAHCQGAVCASGQTCGAAGCTAESIPAGQLSPWTGEAPSIPDASIPDASSPDAGIADASIADAGAPDAMLNLCGFTFVDLTRDPYHCGNCITVCWLWQQCLNGACVAK